MKNRNLQALAVSAALSSLFSVADCSAQIAVRPDDPTGLSVREARVRVIHSDEAKVPGTSMHLQQTDPWLAYQRGRSYFFHEWGRRDGVFSQIPASNSAAAATTSCGMCHNLPFRSPGSGGNTAEPIGYGRNTPHLFGAGLIEMLGEQIEAHILAEFDTNRNGFLDVPAETQDKTVQIEATPGTLLDFGRLDDADGDGWPDLNTIVKVRLVDAQGKWKLVGPEGQRLHLGDPGVAGYVPVLAVFSSTRSDHQFSTLRVFTNGVLRTVMGVASDDPTSYQSLGSRPDWIREEVWAKVSNAGARQLNLNLSKDSLRAQEAQAGAETGIMSEGEIDLLEWYLLNHPAPARGRQTSATRRGRELLEEMQCTSCHVADWALEGKDEARGLSGDRRFFDLEVRHDPATDRLEGRLYDLTREETLASGVTVRVPKREGFLVQGLFSDLRHHDLGERFHESIYARGRFIELTAFRTPPLWGVASTAPYGHDGRSMTLDDVIRRHGGEAASSARAYIEATAEEREALLAFLGSLVLYQPDTLPADLNGDGDVATAYRRDGLEVGPERFHPELLFRTAPRYRGWVRDAEGTPFFSFELMNLAQAYGQGLEALRDDNRNVIPDFAETMSRADAETQSVAQEAVPTYAAAAGNAGDR